MKIIRFGLLSVLSLFVVITAITLFIPSHIRISRAVNMNAGSETIMQEIGDLKKWKYWYPGFDTLSIIPVSGTADRLTEARIASTSTTIVLTANGTTEVLAQFNSGNSKPVTGGWKVITYSSNDSLTVQWYLDFSLHWYPWEKFLSLTYDKMYGQQMEQGLKTLKKNVER